MGTPENPFQISTNCVFSATEKFIRKLEKISVVFSAKAY
jgi:hypothetical protein